MKSKTHKKDLLLNEKELLSKYKNEIDKPIIDISNEINWQDGIYIQADIYEKISGSSVLISVKENIKIKVNQQVNKENFKESLERTSIKHVKEIRSKNKFHIIVSLTLFVVGAVFLVLSALEIFQNIKIINETLMIISWVFIWTATEKFFFERKALKMKRTKLLYICNSEIISDSKTNKKQINC